MAAAAVPGAGLDRLTAWDPSKPFASVTKAISVQPVLMYRTPEPKPMTSWKSWGGVQSTESVAEETARIDRELADLKHSAFQFLPAVAISSPQQAAHIHSREHDAVLVYAATGSGELLNACFSPAKDTLIFVRHRSGPVSYWYEALSTRYLRTGTNLDASRRPHVDDVVVDDYRELASKLTGLAGARNLTGSRIVALGGAAGKYAREAPQFARSKFGVEIAEISYEDFGTRIAAMRADKRLTAAAENCARKYLALPGTVLKTEPPFVTNSFLLYAAFHDLMAESGAQAFTIRDCMSTIMPMAETTACLTLELLNDEGFMAFCESDFVIIPAGILLRHIAGLPVFLHNSTFPHRGIVTCAHCTSPRRMNGRDYNPAQILTHYESEYGAAPKVEFAKGQQLTFIDPEYSSGRWLGFKGVVRDNPFYQICRSQQDVEIQGRWEVLKGEARDSHWVLAYGDSLDAVAYAARKLSMRWTQL